MMHLSLPNLENLVMISKSHMVVYMCLKQVQSLNDTKKHIRQSSSAQKIIQTKNPDE